MGADRSTVVDSAGGVSSHALAEGRSANLELFSIFFEQVCAYVGSGGWGRWGLVVRPWAQGDSALSLLLVCSHCTLTVLPR